MLKYPKKSHRKKIRIPEESKNLAEALGIVMGDGGINNDWQLVISMNARADKEYAEYVKKLFENLFKIEVAVRTRPERNVLLLICSSVTLIEFLISKGSVRGDKIKQQINIPGWIKNNREYQKAFVRGLMDTDGCLYIHKHRINSKLYQNIGFCFTSYSKKLLNSVAEILKNCKIMPHIAQNNTRIYLYKQNEVFKYLKILGTSNYRISNKYDTWRGRIAV